MRRCLTVLLLLFVSACAQPVATVSSAPDLLLPLSSRLVLPTREPSGLTEYELPGSTTEFRSTGAIDAGSALVLDSESSGFEYGVYRFNLLTESPDSVSVLLEEAATTGAWIGLANYATDRWEFDGPFIKQKTLVIDNADFISPAGNIWVAVITASETATVNALSVRTIRPNNAPPSAAVFPDVASGNAPLSVQFDASASTDADGEIIEYAWDFDANGSYEEFTDTPQLIHVFSTPGVFSVKLRVTDDQFARSTATVDISIGSTGNLLPIAAAIATPDEGDSPFMVNFDASSSVDPDGSIVNYDWDFETDGTWDLLNAGPGVGHFYSTAGVNIATLRVTDNAGAQDLGLIQVTVHGWPDSGVTVALESASTASLLTVAGHPAIAYHASGAGASDLKFVRATDPAGSAWAAAITLDSPGQVGAWPNLLLVNGNPAISYMDETNGDVKFIRATTADGSGWGAPVIASSPSYVGNYLSMAIINGHPAVSFYDSNNFDLKFVRASDANGAAWAATVTPDSSGQVGWSTSLAEINGRPAISYYDVTNANLKYVRANDPDGATWGSGQTLDSPGDMGFGTSLAVVNGNPAIAYRDGTNMDLKFIRATDSSGGAWAMALVIDSAGNVGGSPSLEVVNGVPAIAYQESVNLDLKYIVGSDADGSAWGLPLTLQSSDNIGGPWLSVINGLPAISYPNSTDQTLNFLRYF